MPDTIVRRLSRIQHISVRLVLLGAWVLLSSLELSARPPVPVVVTIQPLRSWVEAVGGDRVRVTVLIPPGRDPHTFEPRPSDIAAIYRAKLLVRVGLHLEASWIDRAISGVDSIWVFTIGPAVPTIDDPPNPHVWLSLVNAQILVDSLVNVLSVLDPPSREEFQKRAEVFLRRANALHAKFQEKFRSLPRRSFVAQHPTWSYVARDYGLHQVAVLEVTPGQEPGPRTIARLIRLIREKRVPVLITEPQLPQNLVRMIQRETKIRVVQLDPLGGLPGHENYLRMMQENLEALYQAFQEASP